MEPILEMAAQIDREKIGRARQQSPQEKFRAGLELFDLACRIMTDGIRMQHPNADAAEIKRLLKARLALLDEWETPG